MAYKLSFYTIFTEQVEENCQNPGDSKRLLFCSRTSGVVVIRERHYDAIREGRFDDLPAPLMEELIKAKGVVPAGSNELEEVIQENKQAVSDNKNIQFVIQPTAYCQLGCDYCGQEHSKAYMSDPAMQNILSRVEQKLNTCEHTSLSICWFGSEPLVGLKQIRVLSPALQQLAAEKGVNYFARVVTNGLSLKEDIYEELITVHKVNSIEITLDGTAESHDARRHTKSKEKTFDIIFANLLKIVDRENFAAECNINIRCNADERNADYVIPLIELLASHGLHKKVNFYIAAVYSWGNDAHLLTPKEEMANREIDWFLAMKQHGFPVNPLPGRTRVVCTTVMRHNEVFDAFGNIYNCTEVPYVPAYDGGKYATGHLMNHEEVKPDHEIPFLDWNDKILSKDKSIWCWNCRILPVCGGRCPKNWDEGIPPCPIMKFNMEDRIGLAYYICKEKVKDVTTDEPAAEPAGV